MRLHDVRDGRAVEAARAAARDGRAHDARGNGVHRRPADDVGSCRGVGLQTQRADAVGFEVERDIVRGAEEVRARRGAGVAAGYPQRGAEVGEVERAGPDRRAAELRGSNGPAGKLGCANGPGH